MNRLISNVGLAGYVLLAAILLFWWAPHFFLANLQIAPQGNYRYIGATGIPMALLAVVIAARQSLLPRFSLVLTLELLAAAVLMYLGIISFNFLPQSVFFFAAHLGVCGLFVAVNAFRYRQEIAQWEKRRAAMMA